MNTFRIITISLLFFLAIPSHAFVIGPTKVSIGVDFVVTWDGDVGGQVAPDARLKDVSTGQWYFTGQQPRTFNKTTATAYTFEEYICLDFWGVIQCALSDSHIVVVTGTQNVADSLYAQMLYDYEIRTGDFDGNGYTDILVDRLTSGVSDGSLQTTILEQSGSGYSPSIPTSSELSTARTYPVNNGVTVNPTDQNFDGFADLILSGIDLFTSEPDIDDLILYASGTNNVSQPMGIQPVNERFRNFFGELGMWRDDQDFFLDNLNVTLRPEFTSVVICNFGDQQFGFFPFGCYVDIQFSGFVVQSLGIGFDTATFGFVGAMQQIWDNDDMSGGSRWEALSSVLEQIIGVPSFGNRQTGPRVPTNHDGDTVEDEFEEINVRIVFGMFGAAEDPSGGAPSTWPRHSYSLSNTICSTSSPTPVAYNPTAGGAPAGLNIVPSVCTEENVYCWAKRNPAPRTNGSTATVSDREDSVLWVANPIRTHIFDVPNVLVNNTLVTHRFHDPLATPNCGDHSNVSSIPGRCSFVHRRVAPSSGNIIKMETTGEGHNPTFGQAAFNTIVGRAIFDGVDSWIRRRLAIDGACTDGP